MPEAWQAGQHYTVRCHDKNLNIMWSGSIGRIHSLTVGLCFRELPA